jgi:hypothetical protein
MELAGFSCDILDKAGKVTREYHKKIQPIQWVA